MAPSMEQLNEFEQTDRRQAWGIDKKIPIALILVVALQTLGFTWGAATLSSEVKNNSKIIEKLEVKVDKFIDEIEDDLENKCNVASGRRIHNEFSKRVDNLDDRMLDVERTMYKQDK